jgi:predicted Na+-dependent transporter
LELVSWGITPSQVAGQVLRVQVLPVLAGVLLGQWQPELARRCSRALGGLATVLLILMLLALLLLSGPQLLPFLQHNLVGLVGMAVLSVLSLAVGYGLAGSDPLERRTVALVTGMRNTGLAAQLALTFGKGLPGLVPGILAYVLITVIVTTLFLKWQQRQLGTTG